MGSGGINKTFQVLAESRNKAASRLMVDAIESSHDEIRAKACETAAKKPNHAAHSEIVRHFCTLDETARKKLAANSDRLFGAVRSALLSPDMEVQKNGCQAAVSLALFDLVPTILMAIESPGHSAESEQLLEETLLEMIGNLSVELIHPKNRKHHLELVVSEISLAMERAVNNYNRHRKRVVFQALWLLREASESILRTIMNDPHHPAYQPFLRCLLESDDPNLFGMVAFFVQQPDMPAAIAAAIAKRTDRAFLECLLKVVGYDPSEVVKKNLSQVRRFEWMKYYKKMVLDLNEGYQHLLVLLVVYSGMHREETFGVLNYLYHHGKSASRRASVEHATTFRGAEANQLFWEASMDTDPEIQAMALRQLRSRNIPKGVCRLMECLDSPHAEVRQTVQECLPEFRFERFLECFDQMNLEQRETMGRIIKRIDPETIQKIERGLLSDSFFERMRVMELIHYSQLVPALEEELMGMLYEEDARLRLKAAELLAEGCLKKSIETLEKILSVDPSMEVRVVAKNSLKRRREVVHDDDASKEVYAS